ncbi:MAG: chemotaxis protein CheA [Trichloromonadaceae bacterium]
MLDQQKEVFKEEAGELLTELETSLLELEDTPDDMELVAKVFRAMHTIKGSGAMFGFDAIATFTHEVETVFDLVRNGAIPVTQELVSLALGARDHIRSLLEACEGGVADAAEGARLTAAFKALIPSVTAAASAASAGAAQAAEAEALPAHTYRIRLRLAPDIVMRGTRPDALLRELTELGPCRVVAQTEAIPLLDELDPEVCHVYWDLILTTAAGLNAIKDVFIFVEDDIELKIELIDDGLALDAPADYKLLGEILIERGDLTPADLAEILAARKPIGQLLVESNKISADKITAALQEQAMVREARLQRQGQNAGPAPEAANSVRVPAERLDYLVNRVGELVTVQARLSQAAAARQDSELLAIAEEVERLTAELRDSSLTMRMLPIGTTFSKFKRLVRDLSQELGKEIELKTAGAETELDKTVIEKLGDPLVHLIRNALDHGIEAPAVRLAAGKPKAGTVFLGATHSGDSVVITISDDGKGLDREAILAKGVEKGLIAADAVLGEAEIFNLIFAPGFSTAQVVTGVSGRGVGMDVVKRAIDALRGTISIQSQKGIGSTISIRIPLTLAIVESLLVSVGGDAYALPLSIVEECVELSRADVARAHGRHLVNVRGQIVPYIPLRRQFAMDGESPAIEQVVITRVNGTRVGFVVDHVVGEHQSVIKTLGRMCKEVKGISGATILGDGRVALILDIPHLAQSAELAA